MKNKIIKNKLLKRIKRANQGFTLVELLIVIAIVAVLAAITYGSLIRSQSQQIFNNQFEHLLSMINATRSLAITGKAQLDYTDYDQDKCADLVKLGCTVPDYVTPANYGVNFNDNDPNHVKVTTFADLHVPLIGATGAVGKFDSDTNYALGNDVQLDTIDLGKDFCISMEDANAAQPAGSIFYSPNYADITFGDGLNVTDLKPTLIIKFQDKTAVKRCKQITIHKLAGIPEVGQCSSPISTCN